MFDEYRIRLEGITDNEKKKKENTRIFDMAKAMELTQKIRSERKATVNIGLMFVFALSLIMFFFNIYNLRRNLKLLYLEMVSNI